MLTREQILGKKDIKIEKVFVEEWDDTVCIRVMDGKTKDKLELSLITEKGETKKQLLENFRARLAALTICDEEGNLLFTEADIKLLSEKSNTALGTIVDAASKLNKITPKDKEEMVKNLEDTQVNNSNSESV